MFAPKVAKSLAKDQRRSPCEAQPRDKSAIGPGNMLSRTISDPFCWPLSRERSLGPSGSDSQARFDQAPTREAASSAAWNLTEIPAYPPEQMNTAQSCAPFATPWVPGRIQAKLKGGSVDDPLEREADRVADKVMRMPAPKLLVAIEPRRGSRKCAACEKKDEDTKKLQMKPALESHVIASEAPSIVHELLNSPGQPLDAPSRAFFEPRFEHDFSGVRIHNDAHSEASARSINARAYTIGQR